MIFMILAVTKVTAQDTFVLFEQASHVYTVTKTDGNIYSWSVFASTDLNNEITDIDIVEFVSGKDSNQTEIKWKQAGEYVLVIEEVGLCQNLKAHRVSVINSPTIAFEQLTSEDCPDEDSSFATALVARFDTDNDLSETNYPLTVSYRIAGETTDRTAIVNFAEKLLHIEGIIEDINNETINRITIVSAKNKYGGKLNVVAGQDIHTRTIFKKPVITAIELN
ncbi:hypothetical protein EV201_2299 [Ancylomarina subtilis]|uniref:Uncharacterized protein n=2 Tax=Ancylomarina subtilis TaxID=1639035 RepID=A0A4Q7VBF9_9BACT|nr:hypothetical protein EV201_2299 [Ancylomarina subtilis]